MHGNHSAIKQSNRSGQARHQRSTIRAELSGSDTCTALGITAQSPSPVLTLCRQLVEAGHDPATPLDAYRGEALALRVRSIDQAARLRIGTSGSGAPIFAYAPAADTAPPVRQNREAAG
jgi:hypothetical protein